MVSTEQQPSTRGTVKDRDNQELAFIRQASVGNRNAYMYLVRSCLKEVFLLVFRQIGNPAVADQLTQDIFFAGFHKLRTEKGVLSFRPWILRRAIHQLNAHIDSPQYTHRQRSLGSDIILSTIRDQSENSENYDEAAFDALRAVIAELDPVYRNVFALCDLAGLSHQDAAHILACDTEAVRSRLNAARLHLQNQLFQQSDDTP